MSTLEGLGLASLVFVLAFTWHAAVAAPGVGQTPRSAIIEAWFNIVIGFSINFAMNLLVIPLAVHGGHLDAASNWWMGWVFTTVSIVRQYALRRWFNARLHAAARRFGGKL